MTRTTKLAHVAVDKTADERVDLHALVAQIAPPSRKEKAAQEFVRFDTLDILGL